MKIEAQDGYYLATGTCDGTPYLAEGTTRVEAMRAALLLIGWRHLRFLVGRDGA